MRILQQRVLQKIPIKESLIEVYSGTSSNGVKITENSASTNPIQEDSNINISN